MEQVGSIPADQLPLILGLLEDASPQSEQTLLAALETFGAGLRRRLTALPEPLSRARREQLHEGLRPARRRWLRESWGEWETQPTDAARLEAALSELSRYLSGFIRLEELSKLLDDLASVYRTAEGEPEARSLARFLFQRWGLKGPARGEVRPEHSDPVFTIREKRGLPITLASIYILVGTRLGLRVRGCNVPGHFLAIGWDRDGQPVLVDGTDGGNLLDEATFQTLQRRRKEDDRNSVEFSDLLALETNAHDIVRRVLRNLAATWQGAESPDDVALMIELLDAVEGVGLADKSSGLRPIIRPETEREEPPDRSPRFEVGQTVKHRRYSYRGIIVGRDDRCQADELWYRSNERQPDREQPWYHVLVDKRSTVTYAAQSSLGPDDSDEPIRHPLLAEFFWETSPGQYVRNDRPWPPEG